MSEDPNRGHSFDEFARSLASGSLSRRRALKIFAAALVGALVPSRALAAEGPCPPGSSDVKTICHRPVGGPPKTLCLPLAAADSHLNLHNGPPGAGPDTEGACPPSPPPPPPPGPPSPPGPPPPPGPPCSEKRDPCESNQDCCRNLVCKGEPKRCRRRDDDECRERRERCGGDHDCCGNLVCRGEPGEKRCRRRRRDDD